MSLHSFTMPVREQAQVLPPLQTDLPEVIPVHPDRLGAVTADRVPNLSMDCHQFLQNL